MDISINDLIRYSLEVVTSKLEDGAIDNLFGDSLVHPEKKEVSFSAYSRKFSMAILSLFRSTSITVSVISLNSFVSISDESS